MKHGWTAGAAAAVLGLGGAIGALAPVAGASAPSSTASYRLSATGTGVQLTLDGHTVEVAASELSAGSASGQAVVSSTAPVLTGVTTVHTGEPWAGQLPIALLSMSLLAGLGLLARRHLLVMGHLLGRSAGRAVRAAGKASHGPVGSGLRGFLRSPSGPGPGPAAHRGDALVSTPRPIATGRHEVQPPHLHRHSWRAAG
jgi:hypothetical protein